MNKIAIALCFLLFSGIVPGQEIDKVSKARNIASQDAPPDTVQKHWLVQGSGSLAFSQAAFSNWAAGGENSIGLNAWINFKANYRNKKHIWSNNVDLGYGFNLLGKMDNPQFTKTNDKLEITTAYSYEIHKNHHWYFTVLANFRTQFSNGYNYPDDSTVISKFMAPGYLVFGPGITYAPANWFYLYLSPSSGRFTFVNDQTLADKGAFGVDPGKTIRGEIGPYLRADLNKDLAKNINLTSSLELFTDYLHDFGCIDVNWNLLLSMKVNKWLAASITAQVIYDNDVIAATQFKEMLGLGVTYKIN